MLPVLQSLLDWYSPPWVYPANPPQRYTPKLLMQHMGVLNGITDHMTPYDFVLLADAFDVPLRYVVATTRSIRRELDAGRPVIAYVWYGAFADRQSVRYTGAQYVIVTGYDVGEFIIHDSNWYGRAREKGVCKHVPVDVFMEAFGAKGASHINQPANQALFMSIPKVQETPQ